MLEYAGLWLATVGVVTGVGGVVYLIDRALARRWREKQAILANPQYLFARNDVGANVRAFGDIEPVSMCGGCGRDLVAGQICPGPEKCETFKQPSLFNA
jgi:hypothetical protein